MESETTWHSSILGRGNLSHGYGSQVKTLNTYLGSKELVTEEVEGARKDNPGVVPRLKLMYFSDRGSFSAASLT